ncbi:GntR family transcriptional regulator [Demequina mangrovi]|uniref:Transcriptional regulator, GntR family n=1 Tax=Demequina mangrovi TaxID=1043493 RepID=A0A1H6UT03_9MICO|nr:GntR family transcriptional regulator [Demequina mangrovi]SEI91042.1 transcriptional regulator, GntR family [Demequina mangrovi]
MEPEIMVTSVVDALVEDLRHKVLSGELAPGTPLTELEVATRYDVARASARAAIDRLTGEKVLVRANYRTARVIALGPEDVRDIYRTRARLESSVLRELARTRHVPEEAREANAQLTALWAERSPGRVAPDMRFHTSLVDAAGSERTSAVYRSLAFETRLCMARLQVNPQLDPDANIAEHARILDLIAAGDADGAAAMLEEHLARARELLAASLGGEAGPEANRPSSALPPAS